MEPLKLTVKQENFCNYYIESSNASAAYRRAYNAEKMTDKQIWEESSKLLATPKVSQRVAELKEGLRSASDITKEKLLTELSNIAFSSIADLHNTWIDKKDFEALSRKEKASIKSISTRIVKKNIGTQQKPEIVDVEQVKVELYDKISAIQTINKMLGYDMPKEVNIRQTLLDIETGTDEG